MKKEKNVFNIKEIIFIVVVASFISAFTASLIFCSSFQSKSGISYAKLATDESLKEFLDVYSEILSGYFENVDSKKAIESAINGLTSYLGDKYTTFLNNEDASALNEALKGTYEGFGFSLTLESNPVIYKVYENTPASIAGLEKNDIIVKVNDIDVSEMSNNEIINYVKENSDIKLQILRNDVYLTFNLSASTIILPQVSYEVIEENNHKIGYLYIETFSATISEQVRNTLKYLEDNGIESLILDLRNNGGGYLDEANKIINMFTEKGKLMYSLEDKSNKKNYLDETDEKRDYPILIIQNGATASASEILTAALIDSYGAKTLGTISYGKGKVQQKIDLNDGNILKYTTSKWIRPNGECIDGVGISPTYLIELEYIKDDNDEIISIIDRQLEKAIELLSK